MKKVFYSLILCLTVLAAAYCPSLGQTSSQPPLAYSGGRLRLLQPTFTPWNSNKSYFTIGSNTRRTWPAGYGLNAFEIGLPLTLTNTSAKSYIGTRVSFDLQGTPVSPSVIGSQVAIFSNSFTPTGSASLIGYSSSVDVGGPVAFASGGQFGVATGSAGAAGTETLTGVGATTSIHNAGATNVYTGDFWLASSPSSASTVTNAYALRIRSRVNEFVTFTNLRFISLAESSKTTNGVVGTSYGIYADNTIDLGTTRYFIYSTSTSPSRLAGDIRITDTTKGIILTSPDGTCYRFTVANGGALSAGAAVTCQ